MGEGVHTVSHSRHARCKRLLTWQTPDPCFLFFRCHHHSLCPPRKRKCFDFFGPVIYFWLGGVTSSFCQRFKLFPASQLGRSVWLQHCLGGRWCGQRTKKPTGLHDAQENGLEQVEFERTTWQEFYGSASGWPVDPLVGKQRGPLVRTASLRGGPFNSYERVNWPSPVSILFSSLFALDGSVSLFWYGRALERHSLPKAAEKGIAFAWANGQQRPKHPCATWVSASATWLHVGFRKAGTYDL